MRIWKNMTRLNKVKKQEIMAISRMKEILCAAIASLFLYSISIRQLLIPKLRVYTILLTEFTEFAQNL